MTIYIVVRKLTSIYVNVIEKIILAEVAQVLVIKLYCISAQDNQHNVVLDDKDMTFEMLESFLEEATLMIDFKHPNVLSLLGIVYQKGERPLVILPFMENGDLRSYIQRDDVVCIYFIVEFASYYTVICLALKNPCLIFQNIFYQIQHSFLPWYTNFKDITPFITELSS